MKRKVKRYDEGGVLTDRYGNPVKSGSGEDVKTRFGSSTPKEDRPTSSGVEDYASMGKRSGAMPAKSTWSGAPDIKEETKTEIETTSEPDSVAGKGAKNLASEPDVEVKKKTVIKKKPKYDVGKEGPAKIGNQSFMPSDAERRRRLEESDKPLEGVHPESYFMPGPLGALSKLATAKRISKIAPELNTVRAPMQKALEYAGSKAKQLTNEPLKLGMKKGGSVKKMASGGKVSTASSRGDGIAQRGKTKGRMC